MRVGPLAERNKIVINPAVWCRPCGDRCIFDQPYRLRTISIEQVLQAASDLAANMVQKGSRENEQSSVGTA